MKRILAICVLTVLLFSLSTSFTGCAEEPMWEVADAAKIDISLYAPSDICYNHGWGQNGFVDAPGILLYEVQNVQSAKGGIGTKTAFINKASGTSHLFCFDPLCTHVSGNCIASEFSFVDGMMAYNAVSDKLYCIRSSPEFGGGGFHGKLARGIQGKLNALEARLFGKCEAVLYRPCGKGPDIDTLFHSKTPCIYFWFVLK